MDMPVNVIKSVKMLRERKVIMNRILRGDTEGLIKSKVVGKPTPDEIEVFWSRWRDKWGDSQKAI
jgi:hypothetical protein